MCIVCINDMVDHENNQHRYEAVEFELIPKDHNGSCAQYSYNQCQQASSFYCEDHYKPYKSQYTDCRKWDAYSPKPQDKTLSIRFLR